MINLKYYKIKFNHQGAMINSKTTKHWMFTCMTCMIFPFFFFFIFFTQNTFAAESEDPKILRDALKSNPEFEIAFLSGQSSWKIGNLDESQKAWQIFFEKARSQFGNDHIITETAAFYLGDTYRQNSDLEQALPLLERASKGFVRLIGAHPDTAQSLNNLAEVHRVLNQHEKALPLQQHALDILEKVQNFERSNTLELYTALSLINLADTYDKIDQPEKALQLYKRSLLIFDKQLGSDHPSTAMNMGRLAAIYNSLAMYSEALPLQQKVLTIYEKNFGPEHQRTANSLSQLASTYASLAQYTQALPLQQRAVAIYEKNFGPEHSNTTTVLEHLAGTYSSLAQYDYALKLQNLILAIDEKQYGSEHPKTAISLSNLAETYSELGQYDKVIALQIRAQNINEKKFGQEHSNTARTLGNLAGTYSKLGQFEKALPLQERALAISEKLLGEIHPQTATSLRNLAGTLFEINSYDKALSLAERALAIDQKILGPEHPDTSISLSRLATIYTALGDYKKALELQKRVLKIREKTLGTEHPSTGAALNNLAHTYIQMAQYESAISHQHNALQICEKLYGQNHEVTGKTLSNLAYIHLKNSEPELGATYLKIAVNIFQNQRKLVSKIGVEELDSYSQLVSSVYKELASVLTDLGRLAEAQLILDMLKESEQFDFIGRSSDADPRSSRIGYNSTEQIWVNRYRQIADQLAALGAEERTLQKQAKLGLTSEQKQRQQTLQNDLLVARKAFDAFLHELRDSFAKQGPARTVEVLEISQQSLREIQALLKELGSDTVLLQYYVTDNKVGILLTTSGIQLARTTPIKSKELNRQIVEFRRLLRDPKANTLPAAQALYQLLLAPVEKDLEQVGAKNIMLSLDGVLRYLPFAALHDGKEYLVQRWNMPMYTSVTKDKLRDAVTPQWQAAGLGLTRAVGEFKALPAVKAEMSSIFKTSGSGVLPGEIYLDEAFDAKRLKDVSQRKFQLLHVASHFQFSPGTEINSFLLLGDGQQLSLGDIRTQNYRFDNVDLLTLSACDTGLGGGRDAQGREIEGFGVIAQQQGAKAVLATLWPVADQSTATLMASMYKQRQAKSLTKIEALRQAQLSLLSQPKYAHPFYWAPFILMGNWK
ncbi:MAG: tetratricopeptide repeat protein [Limnohabitans sp.]